MNKLRRMTAIFMVAVIVFLSVPVKSWAASPEQLGAPEIRVVELIKREFGYNPLQTLSPLDIVVRGESGNGEYAEIKKRLLYTFARQYEYSVASLAAFSEYIFSKLPDGDAVKLSESMINYRLTGEFDATLNEAIRDAFSGEPNAAELAGSIKDDLGSLDSTVYGTCLVQDSFGPKQKNFDEFGGVYGDEIYRGKPVFSLSDGNAFAYIGDVLNWPDPNTGGIVNLSESTSILSEEGTIGGKEKFDSIRTFAKYLQGRGLWFENTVSISGDYQDTESGLSKENDPWESLLRNTDEYVSVGFEILGKCGKCAKDETGISHIDEHSKDKFWLFLCNGLDSIKDDSDKRKTLAGILGGNIYFRNIFLDGVQADASSSGSLEKDILELTEFLVSSGDNSLTGMYQDLEKIAGFFQNGDMPRFDPTTSRFSWIEGTSIRNKSFFQRFEQLHEYLRNMSTEFTVDQSAGTYLSKISSDHEFDVIMLSSGLASENSELNKFFGLDSPTIFQQLLEVGKDLGHDTDHCEVCKKMNRKVPGRLPVGKAPGWLLTTRNGWAGKINYMSQLRSDIHHIAGFAKVLDGNWETDYSDELTWLRYVWDLSDIDQDSAGDVIEFLKLNRQYNNISPNDTNKERLLISAQNMIVAICNSEYSVDGRTKMAFIDILPKGSKAEVEQLVKLGSFNPTGVYSMAQYNRVTELIASTVQKIVNESGLYSDLQKFYSNLENVESDDERFAGVVEEASRLLGDGAEVMYICTDMGKTELTKSQFLSGSGKAGLVDAIDKVCLADKKETCDSKYSRITGAGVILELRKAAKALDHFLKDHLGVEQQEQPEQPGGTDSNESNSNQESKPWDPGNVDEMDDRHYRPEIKVDLTGDKTIDTPQGVSNNDIADAIAEQKRVNWWGSLTQLILFVVGEILVVLSFFYSVLFVMTRTAAFFPRSILQKLSFNKLDAYDTTIPKFMGKSFAVCVAGVLFIMGYGYDAITWVIAKLVMFFNFM